MALVCTSISAQARAHSEAELELSRPYIWDACARIVIRGHAADADSQRTQSLGLRQMHALDIVNNIRTIILYNGQRCATVRN